MPVPSNQQDLTDYYRTQAAVFDSVRSPILDSYEEKIRLIIEEGQITEDTDIVEIGSGTGKYLSRIVAETGASGVGIEKSEHMYSVAQAACTDKVKYINTDATKMPLEANSVDVFYAVNSIHQINDKDALFKEVYRVLRPSGIFLVVTPDLDRLSEFLLYKACPSLLEFENTRLPTLLQIQKLGERHGFRFLNAILSNVMSNKNVTLNDFLYSVTSRFLSCLSDLSNSDIQYVINQVKICYNKNSMDKVSPYFYLAVTMIKGEY